jgi:hypothetical protein
MWYCKRNVSRIATGGGIFLRVMWPRLEVDHSPSISGEVRSSTPLLYAFMARAQTTVALDNKSMLLVMLTALLKYVDYFIACNISRHPFKNEV